MPIEPFDPVRLQIPKIKVDAAIEITTVQDGVMTNPVDPWKAGWYQSFSRPGEWTNTVIAGHRDWWGVRTSRSSGILASCNRETRST